MPWYVSPIDLVPERHSIGVNDTAHVAGDNSLTTVSLTDNNCCINVAGAL